MEDLVFDRLGQFGGARPPLTVFETFLAVLTITAQPLLEASYADAYLLGDHLLGEALLQVQFYRSQPIGKSPPAKIFRRSPPRGGGVVVLLLLLYRFIVIHVGTSPSLKCQPISCLDSSHELVASTAIRTFLPLARSWKLNPMGLLTSR